MGGVPSLGVAGQSRTGPGKVSLRETNRNTASHLNVKISIRLVYVVYYWVLVRGGL